MSDEDGKAEQVESLMATPDLARALESEQFRRFLDQVPVAIAMSDMQSNELIAYANPEFEKLSGQAAADIIDQPWSVICGDAFDGPARALGTAIAESSDFIGTFKLERAGSEPAIVDAYSNVIENEDGTPSYRLAALVDVGAHRQPRHDELEQKIRQKDALLYEIQHRVKNNLQMITALMRIEARNTQGRLDTAPFERLAGRIEAMQILYALLADHGHGEEVDLGVYLSRLAAAVMALHAVEGIRLDLKVDAYPVSVNVAMPTGLVVNELLTNAFKHAFVGRDGGTITLHSLSENGGCQIVIADDGIGFPEGVVWPKRGKLGAAIVQSLRENARARVEFASSPGKGTSATITFARQAAAPQAAG